MTSKQVMWMLMPLLLAGCALTGKPKPVEPLAAPYGSPRVWAVAPLRNESGTQNVDGLRFADHLARSLENAQGLRTLPVNRTLAAMEAMRLDAIRSPAEAMQLMQMLGADGLVVGTLTDYDPYDPPKVGIAIELYVNQDVERLDRVDPRLLQSAAVDRGGLSATGQRQQGQPVSIASAYLDAADPEVRQQIRRYAVDRGGARDDRFKLFAESDHHWQLYRISSDLYAEFVGFEMSRRLLDAERHRLMLATGPQPSAR